MTNSDNLCMNCMREIGTEKKCPYCGYHTESAQNAPFLPVRSVVGNRYLTGTVIDTNGEGTTYIGWDMTEKKAVNIREFRPEAFTARTEGSTTVQVLLGSEATFAELRRSFEELWTKLARLSGLSALIKVTDVIEDNGTSYAVYDHFDGISLRDFLLRSKTGYITWEKARQLLMPILSTLGTLHSNGIIHRALSPVTLIIGEDGKIKITGFSISELRTTDSRLNPAIYEGYAAIEQYDVNYPQGPWTDIYSFAAVLYRTLIGSDPVSAKERMSNDRLMVPGKFAEALPAYVINGLINALQILPKDRTRNVEQLRADLSATPSATAAGVAYNKNEQKAGPAQAPAPAAKSSGRKKPRAGLTIFVTALIIIILGTGAFAALALTVFRDRFDFSKVNISTESTTQQNEQIPVPQFAERSYYDIESNPIFNQNFVIVKEEVYNASVSSGYVISQSIAPDTMVEKGTKIILYVSKGSEKVVLPDVVGKSYDEVEPRLSELGFIVNKIETNDGNHNMNEVVMMSPVAGKTYEKGTQVTLKVYVPATEIPQNDIEPDEEDNVYTYQDYTVAYTPSYTDNQAEESYGN